MGPLTVGDKVTVTAPNGRSTTMTVFHVITDMPGSSTEAPYYILVNRAGRRIIVTAQDLNQPTISALHAKR
jgi:hypothetical protein